MQNISDLVREEISDLLSKEITGQLADVERERLRQLRQEYKFPEMENQIVRRLCSSNREFEYIPAWMDFRNKKFRKKIYPLMLRLSMGAAAVIVLCLTFWLLRERQPEMKGKEEAIAQRVIYPGKSVAEITLANGEKIELGQTKQREYETNGAILNWDSAVVKYQSKPITEEVVYHTISIPIGGEYHLILADGSKIWMNADSKLKFPVSFSGKCREVFLEGEAYFDVTKDKAHPFIVHTSRGAIEVLGTDFNIRDYRGENRVVTTLVSGQVVYRPGQQPGKEVFLHPGYQLEDQEGQELQPRQVDVLLYTSWKDGKYIFENATLEEIMQTLSKWYDIAVFYQREEVRQLHFTGDLERYDTINAFLEFLEIGGNVQFSVKGKTIMIK